MCGKCLFDAKYVFLSPTGHFGLVTADGSVALRSLFTLLHTDPGCTGGRPAH